MLANAAFDALQFPMSDILGAVRNVENEMSK
jgi:hypothetical protein